MLRRLQPDIEALLVNRVGHAHGMAKAEYYIAPMDECYRLVGLIRSNWKGLSGGTEVWHGDWDVFSELRAKAGADERRRPMPDLSFEIERPAWCRLPRADACVPT